MSCFDCKNKKAKRYKLVYPGSAYREGYVCAKCIRRYNYDYYCQSLKQQTWIKGDS